jgi:hypothetical protein
MNFYLLATKMITPWAHRGGQFYPISTAPAGAYPITESEYVRFNYYVAQGIALQWYVNQRPYVTAPWTQPIFSNSHRAPDGSTVLASTEYVRYASYAHKAMDGEIGGSYDTAWTTDGEFSGWWRVDFPYTIALTKLTHHTAPSSSAPLLQNVQYFTDETLATPIGSAFTSNTAWEVVVAYDDPENPIMTRGIYFKKTNGNRWAGIGELVLEATSMTYEAGEGR